MITKYRNQYDILKLDNTTPKVTDYTGTNPDFKITNELVPKDAIVNNTFCLTMGAFFDESIVLARVTHSASVPNAEILTLNKDYTFKVLDTSATGATAKEIHCLIQLKEESLSDLLVSYQYVGGKDLYQRDAIIELLKSVDAKDLDTIHYSQLLNRPYTMDVGSTHKHDLGNVVGIDDEIVVLAAINSTLSALNSTISMDTSPTITQLNVLIDTLSKVKQDANDTLLTTASKNIVLAINELRKRVIDLDHEFDSALDEMVLRLTTSIDDHKSDTSNPHKTTKAQVELGEVNNWGATSDVTVQDEHLYATAAAAYKAYKKAAIAFGRTVQHWNYTAKGGEQLIKIPLATPDVDSVQVQGVGQVRNKAWGYLVSSNEVKLAEGLEAGDEVVITIGTPELDSLNIISKLQERVDYLESYSGPNGGPLLVFNSVFASDSDTFKIPPQFNKRTIRLVFITGVQQAPVEAYEIHTDNNDIVFCEVISAGESICIVG